MDAKQIGESIKEARKRKGTTQTALSAVLGIMPLDVLRYETGEIKHIPFEKRAKMSSVLNIPVSELLYDNEEMDKVLEGHSVQWLKSTCKILGRTIRDIGDTMDLVGWQKDEEEE